MSKKSKFKNKYKWLSIHYQSCNIQVYLCRYSIYLFDYYLPVDHLYIVACQRGGVSNEPPGQRQDMGPSKLGNHLDRKFLKERTAHLIRLFLLRQGEPGTSQHTDGEPSINDECCGKIDLFRVQNRVVHILSWLECCRVYKTD